MPQTPKKLYIKTYGCQMNVYDSQRMAEAMAGEGYETTEDAASADMVLLNTCHIREKAAEKVYSELGRLKPLKAANPDLRIGVAGCVAQAEGEEILARAPMVDLVVGPQSYHRLPEMARRAATGAQIDTDFPQDDKFAALKSRPRLTTGPTAFLTVQEGCDKFCAFCVVPYTRGAEVSRPGDTVLAEARALVAQGVREITLLGQNVNAWHGALDGVEGGLAALIGQLARIEGLERLRYTTSHPNDMDDALIAAHGSELDRVLKALNRKHDADSYLRLIERIRAARPDLLLSSDFIVGFPGETEADFQATLDLVTEVGFGQAYSFKYSPRPGTPAAERAGQVAEEVMADRLARLQALLTRQQRDAQEAMVGREVDVLFERRGRLAGQLAGKSGHLHAVHAEAPASALGEVRKLRIVAANPNSLTGVLAG